ncbi:hypothetical protein [Lutimonas sp.]|uniref:hypothetical protein n=1 Tax=Lutimonas sp. TaxID=1872403 RepID=UPI003D9AC116
MTERTTIIIHSSLCYVLAFMFTTIIHEFAHAFTGWLSNSHPVMYHNYVSHLSPENLSFSQQTGIALAGPLISLIQGFFMGGWFFKTKKRGLAQLFVLWASILGFNNFLGYVMTGPLFTAGDIGKMYALHGTSMFLQISFSLLAALGLLVVANRMTRPFLEFSYKKQWIQPEQNAPKFSFIMIMLPYIIGSVIITFLYLPVINIVSIIYPIMSGMIFIYPWRNAVTVKNVRLSSSDQIGNLSWITVLIFMLLLIIFRMVLPRGIAF